MNKAGGALLLTFGFLVSSPGQTSESPLQALAFLADACWQVEGSFGQFEEHCFEWVPGQQHLRQQHSQQGGGEPRRGETLYTVDAASGQIRFVEWDRTGGFRQGLITVSEGELIFPEESHLSAAGIEQQRQRWYAAGTDRMLQITEVQRNGEWQKLDRRTWAVSQRLTPQPTELVFNELALFSPFLGDWLPDPADPALKHNPQVRDRVVLSLHLASGGHFVRIHEGFPVSGSRDRAALEGMAIVNPTAQRIDFVAATRFGWSFTGQYHPTSHGALERIYTVSYPVGENRIPEPELQGWTRRFREIYTPVNDQRMDVSLEIDRDGQWHGWGPNGGRYSLVRNVQRTE